MGGKRRKSASLNLPNPALAHASATMIREDLVSERRGRREPGARMSRPAARAQPSSSLKGV
jgi:hypothetical protein